jgi:hypothetical protein
MTISFCTPLIRENSPILNCIERYNWFGREVAKVEIVNGIEQAIYLEDPSSDLETAIKISTMILSLGLFPLLALIIKFCSRVLSEEVTILSSPLPSSQISLDFDETPEELPEELREALPPPVIREGALLAALEEPLIEQVHAKILADKSHSTTVPQISRHLIEETIARLDSMSYEDRNDYQLALTEKLNALSLTEEQFFNEIYLTYHQEMLFLETPLIHEITARLNALERMALFTPGISQQLLTDQFERIRSLPEGIVRDSYQVAYSEKIRNMSANTSKAKKFTDELSKAHVAYLLNLDAPLIQQVKSKIWPSWFSSGSSGHISADLIVESEKRVEVISDFSSCRLSYESSLNQKLESLSITRQQFDDELVMARVRDFILLDESIIQLVRSSIRHESLHEIPLDTIESHEHRLDNVPFMVYYEKYRNALAQRLATAGISIAEFDKEIVDASGRQYVEASS